MGWGRTLLLGDIGNRLDIEDCERSISALRDTFTDQSKVRGAARDHVASATYPHRALLGHLVRSMR